MVKTFEEYKKPHPSELGYEIDSFRDGEDDGTFVVVYHPTRKVGNSKYWTGTLHVPDSNVRGQTWQAGDVSVDKEDQRKGIAEWMYIKMSEILDMKPSSGNNQSPDGISLWKGFKDKGMFESFVTSYDEIEDLDFKNILSIAYNKGLEIEVEIDNNDCYVEISKGEMVESEFVSIIESIEERVKHDYQLHWDVIIHLVDWIGDECKTYEYHSNDQDYPFIKAEIFMKKIVYN